MTNFKTYQHFAITFVGMFMLLNIASAQEPIGHSAAGMGMGADAGLAQYPLTRDLSDVLTGSYVLEHDHGRVHWSVGHHGFSRFTAVFPLNQATLDFDTDNISNSKLVATVDMAKVDTSIDVFDERLQGANYFNTEKYPTATFTSTKIVDNGDNTMVVSGDLNFLGVSQPAVMNVRFSQAGYASSPPAGYRIGFDATMVVTRSAHGMRKSTISDEVNLMIEAEFVKPGATH